jgi:ABC-2 type transport system ATP-binding protein
MTSPDFGEIGKSRGPDFHVVRMGLAKPIARPVFRTAISIDRTRMIVIDDYHKMYRETVAVNGLTVRVEAGQILGLVGPNGAGKTTTMRAVAGIIVPTRGRLSVAGFDLAADPVAAKQRLAYIPDDPKLFDALTVWEHLEFIAAAYRVDGFEPRALALLERFELMEKKDAMAQELSRGMRQKVAICCGFLHDPAAILFDEPLTGLDPRGIRTLKQVIAEQAREGKAIVISSHLLSLVEDLCTHLLILNRGRALFCGPIAEARSHFADLSAEASLEEIFFRATEGGGENGAAVEPIRASSTDPSLPS